MVKNKNGDVYTHSEVMDKSINEINIDVKDTEALSKKLDKLVLKLEATKECKHTYKKLDGLYEAVGAFLPEDKKKLTFDIFCMKRGNRSSDYPRSNRYWHFFPLYFRP